MYYTPEQTANWKSEQFAYVKAEQKGNTLVLTLNNPSRKNALNPVMIQELAFGMAAAMHASDIWTLLLEAEGDVFCAGADLKAFAGDMGDKTSSIPAPASEILLGDLFNRFHKPAVAKVNGDVFAGGFLLLTGCRIVVAKRGIRLGLPEVKRGLFPFQVMAGLLEVLPPRKVADWCIRGYDLPVEEACALGLITEVTDPENLDTRVDEVLQELHSNSPSAIRMGLEAFARLRSSSASGEHAYLKEMLMKVLQTEDAMEGIAAFKEKRKPSWKGK